MTLGTCSIILYNKKNKTILLQLKDKNAPIYANEYGFFGGHIENKETPKECIQRECLEELEYKLENPKLMFMRYVKKAPRYHYTEEYNPNKTLTQHEGQDKKWFTYQELKHEKNISKSIKERSLEIIKNLKLT
jgi:8-oxo-dGTP diphosphatase